MKIAILILLFATGCKPEKINLENGSGFAANGHWLVSAYMPDRPELHLRVFHAAECPCGWYSERQVKQ